MDPKQDKLTNEPTENASSEAIRSDIKGTRREMDETLDELGERLHPRHLLDDVIDLFRSSSSGRESRDQIARTSKRLGRTVANELKEHPLPALLVGAGLVWWIIDATTEDGDQDEIYVSRRQRALPAGRSQSLEYRGLESTMPPSSSSGIGDGDDDDRSAGDKAREMASSVGEKVSDAASAVGDKISQAASSVGETASDWGDAARHYSARGRRVVGRQAGELQDRFRVASNDYPLAVGGAFLAAGLLTGLLLPRTEHEDEWMGEASDELKEEARRKGEELVEQGKQAAVKTADAAFEEAERRGINADTLAEKAGGIISEATGAAKETAGEEGVAPSDVNGYTKGVAARAGETAKREGKAAPGKSSG